MSPALQAARARSAIRDGFDLLTQTVQQVIPEDTAGRSDALRLLRTAYEAAAMAADELKNQ